MPKSTKLSFSQRAALCSNEYSDQYNENFAELAVLCGFDYSDQGDDLVDILAHRVSYGIAAKYLEVAVHSVMQAVCRRSIDGMRGTVDFDSLVMFKTLRLHRG